MSIEIIKDIISAADLSNTLQLRNFCLYVLCYAGFFRSEEVMSIRRSHITFDDDYMTIKVEKSKTDQLGQGDEVTIAQTGGSACPVSILRDYLSRLNFDPHSDELIFRQLVKTKLSYKINLLAILLSGTICPGVCAQWYLILLFMAFIRLGQGGGLPRLPIVAWASVFFRDTGGGRVFQPRMDM